MTEDDLVEDVFERFKEWSISVGDRHVAYRDEIWWLRTEVTEVDRLERRVHWTCVCVVCRTHIVKIQFVDKETERRVGDALTSSDLRKMWRTIYKDQAAIADFHAKSCLLEWWSKTDEPSRARGSPEDKRDPGQKEEIR